MLRDIPSVFFLTIFHNGNFPVQHLFFRRASRAVEKILTFNSIFGGFSEIHIFQLSKSRGVYVASLRKKVEKCTFSEISEKFLFPQRKISVVQRKKNTVNNSVVVIRVGINSNVLLFYLFNNFSCGQLFHNFLLQISTQFP